MKSQSDTIPYPPLISLFSNTFSIFSKNWLSLVGITAIPSLLSLAFFAFFATFFLGNFLSLLLNRNYVQILSMLPLAVFFLSILSIVNLWSGSALIYYISNLDKKLSIKTVYNQSWKYVSRFFSLTLLIGLITFLGILLLILPGVAFLFFSSLSVYVLFVEGLGGRIAIQKSWYYIKSHSKEYFIRIFIWYLLLMIVSSVFNGSDNSKNTVETVAGLIFNSVTAPLTAIFVYLNYQHLKSLPREKEFIYSKKGWVVYVLLAFLALILFVAFILWIINILSTSLVNPSLF
ncbi:MAG: hypothetical protein ACOX6N_02960 [Patescibacteria group bacterium]|jgi:hypothetical protein